MGSKAGNFEKGIKREPQLHFERSESAKQDDQSELSLAIAKAVTQVLESSDWRALSFPLQANAAKHSKAKNAVKRPMNPFMLYAQAARKKLAILYPDLSYAKLSKTLGRIWKSLDQAEKQPFIDEAERLRQKHKIDHPDYKFQPKRREKKRAHSPNGEREAFENSKISTGDVLKVLSSTGNATHHESQNLWAQTIHNGISSRGGVVQRNCVIQQSNGISPPPPYSGSPRASPSPRIPKLNANTSYEASPQHPITTTNDLTSFTSRYMTPPPPLQRATTASLFSPSTYRIPKSQPPNQSPYAHMSEIHSFPPTTIQNYPSDLSLSIGNSFLKCSPQLARPPHLTPSEDQSSNLLTGVNQILRDMFGNDKNSVM